MKYIRSLFIMVVPIMMQCKINHHVSNNPNMEKLNIESLLKKIDSHTKNGQGEGKSFKEGNLVIDFYKLQSNENLINYSEENLSNGMFTHVSGNLTDGFMKETVDRNNPRIEIIKYYPNGHVHSIEYKYSDKYLKSNPGNIEYPIETSLFYNEDGTLLKSNNINDTFKFSIVDVRKLLSQKGDGLIIVRIDGVNHPVEPIWKIKYFTSDLGLCDMIIDAATGNIISDVHHITTIE